MIILHWRCILLGSFQMAPLCCMGIEPFRRAIIHPFPSFSLWCTSTRTPYFPLSLCTFQMILTHIMPLLMSKGTTFAFFFCQCGARHWLKLETQGRSIIPHHNRWSCTKVKLFDLGYVRRKAAYRPNRMPITLYVSIQLSPTGFCMYHDDKKKNLCFETGEQCPCMKTM